MLPCGRMQAASFWVIGHWACRWMVLIFNLTRLSWPTRDILYMPRFCTLELSQSMGKYQVDSHMPNPKSSCIKWSQLSNPSLRKSLNRKLLNTQVSNSSQISHRLMNNICVTISIFAVCPVTQLPPCFNTCDMAHVQSVFKTLCGSSITRLELGGPSGQTRDRIFVASGAIVRGYTRRGKQFLDFNTNTTEAVRSL